MRTGYAVKLDQDVLKELKEFCETKGYKQSSFVEKALREQMEREELKDDIYDLVTLRSQEGIARPSGERDGNTLPKEVYQRCRKKILALASEPRPQGCQKLVGEEGYRIRVGDYRILYRIDDEAK